MAIDNKFGLRYFCGHPENILHKKFPSLIGYSNEPTKIETYTKTSLETFLKQQGYYTNFYYPLPDYKFPNVIFSEKEMPKYNSIDKYISYPTQQSDTIMNEIDVFREILKTNPEMFPFFANSFLVEMALEPIDILYKYISFNNMRKPEYRLITKIADNYVEKQVVGEEAENHYRQIKENIHYLEEQELHTVDYIENGTIKSRYIDQKYLLNEVLTHALAQNQTEQFDSIMAQYIQLLQKNTIHLETAENTVFEKYHIAIEHPEWISEFHFAPIGLWDMTFKNCFYLENQFYFFDQEWKEENLPVEFILYRSILYTISLRRYRNIDTLFETYGLQKYRTLFEALDNALQEKIRDSHIWALYSQNTYFDIDSTKQELENIGMRDHAKQLALENLTMEKEQLLQENETLKGQKQTLELQCKTLQEELQIEKNQTLFEVVKKKLQNKKERISKE